MYDIFGFTYFVAFLNCELKTPIRIVLITKGSPEISIEKNFACDVTVKLCNGILSTLMSENFASRKFREFRE